MSAECREPGPGGNSGASGSGACPPRSTSAPWRLPRWRAGAAAAVLCYVNLLNYMNWFIVAGEEGTVPWDAPARCPLTGRPASGWHRAPTAPSGLKLSPRGLHPCRSHPWREFQPSPNGGGVPIQPHSRHVHTGVGAR